MQLTGDIWGETGERYLLACAPNEDSNQSAHATVRSESSLSAWISFAALAIQNAPREDSDQTARMLRVLDRPIWVPRKYSL